ncbi:MAG: hypothetical protein GYA39_08135 [Methanothrix sp.]|nr:hypothetical protein [Methanothrix sp.]
MVTFNVDAKVKGTGKDGALGVQISGDGASPISAKISGDSKNPLAIGPIEISPITVAPDLKSAAETLNIPAVVDALTKLSQGVKVEIATSGAPLSIALGRMPIDLTISVSSPAQETVFKVEIRGTLGE